MLVPAARMAEAAALAAAVAAETRQGPVVNRAQWEKIQGLIATGIKEGATLSAGGLGRPDDRPTGFYVKPTVFADVRNTMTIAREEIFGPVLVIIPYTTLDEALAIANDTPYGLAAYVQAGPESTEAATRLALGLRAGNVHISGARPTDDAPFGGYKQSGNGREKGPFGIDDMVEIKAVFGAHL